MNLLKDAFISTTEGKVSLKTLLTSEQDYQLQYYFDETQLAMIQLLSSLATVLLKPTLAQLRDYLANGINEQQYDKALNNIGGQWFESHCFMRSKMPEGSKVADGPIAKLVSGVACGTSANAIGLFSELKNVERICLDCSHVLNYNLHMNIKGEYFGTTGATGIRGGGAISTLIAGATLKQTVLFNAISVDLFNEKSHPDDDAEQNVMWQTPLKGNVYQAQKISLSRGLFALVYHIDFPEIDEPCVCDVCGHSSEQSITTFKRIKYSGNYGSTKNGRDAGAGWWLHPYTPRVITDDGTFAVCARDQNFHSWQELSSYVVGKETDKAKVSPAFVVQQYRKINPAMSMILLVGGNIAIKGLIVGQVYDLYSMPSSLDKNLARITQVIESGLQEKERLSRAFKKILDLYNKKNGLGYNEKFVAGIKDNAMQRFISNAQQIIQRILLDVNRKDARSLRENAVQELKQESRSIVASIQRKYQHDLPLFKALVKGERELYKS